MKCKRFYQNEPKLNGVFSRNNLFKIKDEAYIINLGEYESIGTHWIALYIIDNNVKYFDSFGVEHIPKEIKKIIGNKNIITNIYRIQAYDSIICECFCIGFIDFMLKGKSLFEYINLFSPNDYEKNDKIILKYFQYEKKLYCVIYSKYRKFEKPKIPFRKNISSYYYL